MIISRTPLRISLAGGGTDVASFYSKYGGAIVSLTIDKFVYVAVNDKFDGRIRASYSITENVDAVGELKHDIIRETLNLFEMDGLEVVSISDIPGSGSGLGSSSSLTVGLINALARKKYCKNYPAQYMAEQAYFIERTQCNHPGVGKQDQLAAAYGGLHYYDINHDGCVSVEPIYMTDYNREWMESHMLLLYTGMARSADGILERQEDGLRDNKKSIRAARKLYTLAYDLASEMQEGKFENVGVYLAEGWHEKKKLVNGISDPQLDNLYTKAFLAGADGGKLLGAGGGGFFLFWASPERHAHIVEATGLRHVKFKMHDKGSEIIYAS
jgi:D-glycero-alpha-D-manno-heptose-7-phosphate kinase